MRKKSTTETTSINKEGGIMTPRGIRNCNPGNIRVTKDKWQGLRSVQTDKEFFQFTEMKWGYRALIRTLQNYRRIHGCYTITDFITRWAPSSENNTLAYIKSVCFQLGVPVYMCPMWMIVIRCALWLLPYPSMRMEWMPT